MIRVPDRVSGRVSGLARRLAEPLRARVQAYAVEAVTDHGPGNVDVSELRADVERISADLALLAARLDALSEAAGSTTDPTTEET